ncbi:hypothetical protein GE09DRAFT_1096163 [Coniochaeta sp. 2T2.1]|nr:hypothetical protein GE09DRAFT_1096163 [Coniochaeta sp. 2T2.1]
MSRHGHGREKRRQDISMRVGPGQHAGDDVAAHGPARPPSPSHGPGSVSDPPGPALHDASWQAVQNAVQSPDHFSDGRKLYLERPLPPPPQPNNASRVTFAMPARPSTASGGPNAKASALLGFGTIATVTANSDKRMSKDDMYLSGYTGQRKKGLQPYRVGMRTTGGLPTPESSPEMNYATLSSPLTLPPRVHTPDTLSSGEIQIGMAIGSPSHPPDALPWESQTGFQSRQPLTPPDLYQTTAAPVHRQKTQRRKLFGGLFGSRKKEEPSRASLETTESSSATTTSMASQPFGESTPTRSYTVADRKAPKYQPIVVRSNTLPVVESPASEPRRRWNKPQGSQLAVEQKPDHEQTNYLSPNPTPSTYTLGSSPLLDIEIPSIKMERYSIMFSNVLNQQATSSSLLARRQATLDRLKTINDKILHEEEEKEKLRTRRATTPPPAKSPGFSLFPPTPNHHHHGNSPLTPRRLARSNTSPALLPSPSRASFDHPPHTRKERKTVTIVSPRSMEQRQPHPPANPIPNSLPANPRPVPQQPQPERIISTAEAESFHFGPDESGLILDSPGSISSPTMGYAYASVVDAQPLRPTIPEPEWQIINPDPTPAQPRQQPSSSASSIATTRRSPSSSASSTHTHVTRPSVDTVDVDESDSALKAAVEISIARQISISRQQRTLLRPLKTEVGQLPPPSGRVRAGTVGGQSPIRKVVVSRKEGRVVETKVGTPTEVRDVASLRKSERVVLDGLTYGNA